MTATPTLEARLAELLPQCTWATDCASFAQKTGRTDITPCRPCRDRAAILALIRERELGERERCASQWREVYEIPMRDRIHALEDRND